MIRIADSQHERDHLQGFHTLSISPHRSRSTRGRTWPWRRPLQARVPRLPSFLEPSPSGTTLLTRRSSREANGALTVRCTSGPQQVTVVCGWMAEAAMVHWDQDRCFASSMKSVPLGFKLCATPAGNHVETLGNEYLP